MSLKNIQELKYSDINYGEHTFLQNVLNTRNIYFALNQENPGLFSATIFTDDFESAYVELYNFIRKMYLEKEESKLPTYSLEGHSLYKTVISQRLRKYHNEIKRHHSVSGN